MASINTHRIMGPFNEDEMCLICRDSLNDKGPIYAHEAAVGSEELVHPTHQHCWDDWSQRKAECPTCRIPINPKSLETPVEVLRQRRWESIKSFSLTTARGAATGSLLAGGALATSDLGAALNSWWMGLDPTHKSLLSNGSFSLSETTEANHIELCFMMFAAGCLFSKIRSSKESLYLLISAIALNALSYYAEGSSTVAIGTAFTALGGFALGSLGTNAIQQVGGVQNRMYAIGGLILAFLADGYELIESPLEFLAVCTLFSSIFALADRSLARD